MIDYIIVGGGGSGVPLASRLSSDPGVSVVLVEAGRAPVEATAFDPELLNAGSLRAAGHGHPANWSWPAHLLPDRPWMIARGRSLGGSSATNGGYFVRPTAENFEAWAQSGSEWTYERSLPFLRRLESDLDFGDSPLHGSAGPMPVARPAQDHPITQAFAAAAAKLGHAFEADKNGAMAPGYGPLPMNVVDGVRWNTAMAYPLDGVSMLTDTLVRRIVFQGTRAVGIETDAGEIIRGRQVVLCAGAIGSAHLLLRSGVGPADQLRDSGIAVVHDSPGVGASFSDHPQVAVEWYARRDLTAPPTIMASSLDAGAAEYVPLLSPVSALLGHSGDDRLTLLIGLQWSASRGTITISSRAASPHIAYNYLSEPGDVALLRDAVRGGAGLVAAFDGLFDRFANIDARVLADDSLLDAWIRAHVGTAQHLSGSAQFGPPGDRRVVDQYGRVEGVSGLRVADTSILPTVPHRGTAATAVLIGERIADFIQRGL